MKKSTILIAISLLLVFSIGSFALQNGYDLFQKALAKERGEGNLKEAIALYQKVINETKDESLAAKAQLRIGICYEKLGQEKAKQAQEAFQKVIDNYPQQIDSVKVARQKLSDLLQVQAGPYKNTEGLNIRKVWENPKLGRGNLGEVSPDGQFEAFSDLGGRLAVYDFATKKTYLISESFFAGKKEELTPKALETSIKGEFPIWSPDRRQIAFNRSQSTELCIFGLDGSEPSVLYLANNGEEVYPVDWSSDGKYILAALAKNYQAFQAILISVQDGAVRVLKTFEKPPRSEPRRLGLFSPDGRYVAGDFRPEGDSRERDIFILSINGDGELPLVIYPGDDLALGWSPDGKQLVFASDRSGTWDVWMIGVIEGKPQGDPKLIKGDVGGVWPLGFAKQGSFFYLLEDTLTDVYSANLDPAKKILSGPTKVIQRFVGRNLFPEWSPDGKHLSYVSIRNTGYDRFVTKGPLCIHSMAGGAEREIMPGLRYIWGTRWSPDSRLILAVGSEMKDREGLYAIDGQTGEVTSIIQFHSGDMVSEPEWSHDGKTIYYTHKPHEQKEAQIIAYHLETKDNKEIYRGDFHPSYIDGRNAFFSHDLALSPDGKLLAFNKGWSPVLMVVPTNGGDAREVWRMKMRGEQISTVAWMPGGKELIFASYQLPDVANCTMWRIAVDGGEPQKLGLSMEGIRWLSVHPGAEQIIFCSNRRIKDVWVMENFLPAASENKGGQK